ncbi:MAG: MjaI family restriction endonuclease [Leptospiraceae bacterium]|nr:MjaI family restriction endonuclease [Leptospiraceae bacterium]MCP5498495.1 MjaI family restriction endonuclease [Leptospiraceae bacterium]
MDEFINRLDTDFFRNTNRAWNDLMLNDPWSVGYVSSLIESEHFIKKEDWESFYYNSGKKRSQLLSNHPKIELLNDIYILLNNKQAINNLDWDTKNLNYNYGRTQNDFQKKGEILYNELVNHYDSINLEDCIEAVRFRVICETWNGIILRERKTIENLKKLFPDFKFQKTEGAFDYKYAVDYLVYDNEETTKLGIQIKPQSYQIGKGNFLRNAKTANQKKNNLFIKDYDCSVVYIYSKTDGSIINGEVIAEIEKILKQS